MKTEPYNCFSTMYHVSETDSPLSVRRLILLSKGLNNSNTVLLVIEIRTATQYILNETCKYSDFKLTGENSFPNIAQTKN